jgi:hypothetical protein
MTILHYWMNENFMSKFNLKIQRAWSWIFKLWNHILILDQPTTQFKNPSQNVKNLKDYIMRSYKTITRSKPQIRFGFVVIEKRKIIPNVHSA